MNVFLPIYLCGMVWAAFSVFWLIKDQDPTIKAWVKDRGYLLLFSAVVGWPLTLFIGVIYNLRSK